MEKKKCSKSKNEKFLCESEDLFKLIFELSSAAIAILEADAKISMVNDSFCKMSGFSKDELIGTNWIQKMPVEERERLLDYNRRRLINPADAPEKYEFIFHKKNGELRYGLMSVSVIESCKKTITSFTDITDRKKTEEALRISEERFRSFVECANDIVYTITVDGILTYTSPNWTEQLGHELTEVVGHSFRHFVHPEDLDRLTTVIINNFQTGVKLNGVEYRIRHKNGQWRWYTSSSSPILDSNGQVLTLIGIAHDITEQKLAEEALQEREAFLNTLVQTIPDLIWLKDVDGIYLSCNPMFERYFGAQESEIIGKTDYDFVDPELADFFRENDRIAIENGKPTSNEQWVTFVDDGQRHLIEPIKTPMYNSKGKLIGVLGIARDMTERKRVEEALKEREFFFKESQQAAFIGSYKANYVTGYWESSEVLDQIFGIGKDYIRTINQGWNNIIHPDDLEMITFYMNEEVILKHNPFNAEYRIIRQSDGEIRWVNGLGKVSCDDDNNLVSMIGTIQDITKRKLAEVAIKDSQTKLSLALKIAHLGSWEYDIANDVFTFNDLFYSLFKTTVSQVGGFTMSSAEYAKRFVHPEEQSVVRQEILNSIETNESNEVRQFEHRIIYADGEVGYLTVRFAIVKDDKGKSMKLIGINQDISERIQAEKELKQSEAQLRELNATKDKFFSIIAHDLRGPFSVFLALTELMTLDVQKLSIDEIQNYSEIMRSSAANLFQLLENLLQWSKMQQGSVPFKPERSSLLQLIQASISMEPARNKDISISYDIPDGIEVYADYNMLQTVVRNLVSNAVKFTPKGGEINISANVLNEERVEISVKDSGIGISPEMIDNLFRLDIQTNRLGTEAEPSSGLGLLLCKEFIEKHGGSICVESEVGKGSEFKITLPIEI